MKLNYGYNRGAVMDKCCRTIAALIEKRLTSTELAAKVGYSHKTAHRYIEAVSLCFPVNSKTKQIESGHKIGRASCRERV